MKELIKLDDGKGEILLKKIQEANSKKDAWKMTEKEVIAASNKVFNDSKKFKISITVKEIRELTGL
ncbi:MAG: hypothetical protein Q8M92_03270, partial [Candidatus Subteraquimicrobiales bacterium]|nr:hypothetical protein [Candidatus Subteraquimicrobiales bacterium]